VAKQTEEVMNVSISTIVSHFDLLVRSGTIWLMLLCRLGR